MAQRTTTSQGGVRHMNKSKNAAVTRTKSAVLHMPLVQIGRGHAVSDVRYWIKSKQHLLALSVSASGPACVKTRCWI